MAKAARKISALFENVSADMFVKAVTSFDRNMATLVVTIWVAALGLGGLAIFTVNKARLEHNKTEEATAAQPAVPIINRKPVDRPVFDSYVTRLGKRYENISFSIGGDGALQVTSGNANAFLEWVSALTYLDTVAPQVRWTIRDMCVGMQCGGNSLMRANVVGEQVSFSAPPKPVAEEPE